ncbi:MAG TPA: glycosyltransferase family 39 protein, partial [Anaerolineales bacterium]|nr:glycosyltransferase family 39 protein [Anaerolineales bacterium]
LSPRPSLSNWIKRIGQFFRHDVWQVKITRHAVLFVLVLAVAVFFRTAQVGGVVSEMFSDQAEKLLDVYDVLQGQHKIFFERNTGREGLQFYLIAAVINLFDTGISFLSMKIGTIFLGLAMLPYIYLLGKELGNKTVGLVAMLLTGIAFWPNVLARIALRFILYPAFAAPALYYLVRGLRTGRRNYFIAAAVFLGVGLHGYTPFRAVPILVVVTVLLYWLHNRRKDVFYKIVIWLSIITLISLILFLPLLRVWFAMPDIFNYRTLSRMTDIERGDGMAHGLALVGVFFKNVWDGLLMLNWDSGDIWVNTIPGHPSLDLVTGAFFVLGIGLVLIRYIRQRHWEDAFLLLAVPILMLPSTLVLAYPEENPAPNRAGGAAVIVFILAALAFEALIRAIRNGVQGKVGQRVAVGLGVVLLLFAIGHNYTMTFENYAERYKQSTWNTTELGAVIEQFTDTVGTVDQAWVVAYPHWVDTRLVGINAGFPIKDFAIDPQDLGLTQSTSSPKLFLVKLEDQDALDTLSILYPEGTASLYTSSVPTHSFHVFYVP